MNLIGIIHIMECYLNLVLCWATYLNVCAGQLFTNGGTFFVDGYLVLSKLVIICAGQLFFIRLSQV